LLVEGAWTVVWEFQGQIRPAAAAFGAVLYTVVSGDSIPDALSGIIERALSTSV